MIRILFVEDDPILMSNLRRTLSVMRREWDMQFFASAEEALVSMAERPFDVVVTDLTMPGLSGFELLAMSQYLYPRAVRVLMSDAHELEQVAGSAGVVHRTLRKPCDPAELAAGVQRAFELEQRLSDPDLQSMISEVGRLPSPSRVVMELNDLLGREDASIAAVADVVATDPALVAKLLQLVNSAYFSLSHHVSEPHEAVNFLGFDAVRNLTVATELLSAFESVSPMVQAVVDEIHDHSLAVAHVARELVPDRRGAADAFVAALLHKVGLLLMASEMPERFLELQVQAMRTNLPLTEVEMEVIGAHHADIGAHLLDLWGLPHKIVEAVARQYDATDVPCAGGMDAVHAVHLAIAIVNHRAEPDLVDEQGCALPPKYLEQLGAVECVARLTATSSGA